MTLRRVDKDRSWARRACRHPEHNPPGMIVLPPGAYEHECPGCGAKTVFTVPHASLTSRPFAEIAGRPR